MHSVMTLNFHAKQLGVSTEALLNAASSLFDLHISCGDIGEWLNYQISLAAIAYHHFGMSHPGYWLSEVELKKWLREQLSLALLGDRNATDADLKQAADKSLRKFEKAPFCHEILIPQAPQWGRRSDKYGSQAGAVPEYFSDICVFNGSRW